MSKHTKIFCVGPSHGYARWIPGILVTSIEKADLVLFTGGEDIDPELYDEPVGDRTYFTPKRDNFEVYMFNKAKGLGKKMIGICRGLQLFTALNGGKLIQHQTHPSPHRMYTFDKQELTINSLHHQAAYPFDLPKEDYHVLGWTPYLSPMHLDGNGDEMNPLCEIEGIYFPKTNCLGWQFHPEMMDPSSQAVAYCRRILVLFLEGKLDEYIAAVGGTHDYNKNSKEIIIEENKTKYESIS